MTVNSYNLELTIARKSSSTMSNYDLLAYSKALEKLQAGAVYTVATRNNLPDAGTKTGLLYFVEGSGYLYYSNGSNWVQIGNVVQNQLYTFGDDMSVGALGQNTTTGRVRSPVREFCSASNWCYISGVGDTGFAIKTDNTLWAWGSNAQGKLGIGSTANACIPTREFCSATDWVKVSSGIEHTAAVKSNGSIWTWGRNNNGELGIGTTANSCSPVREICSATDWSFVAPGKNFTLGLKSNGTLWGWGNNSYGGLATGNTTASCSPLREMCSATNWCQISAYASSLAIKTDGSLWGWGRNIRGQLGNGNATSVCSPVREFCSASDWCFVATGYQHTLAIKNTGSLWSWGTGGLYQLGNGNNIDICSPVREFCSSTNWYIGSVAFNQSMAIKKDGSMWGWGLTAYGRTADGSFSSFAACSPVREACSSNDWIMVATGNVFGMALKSVV